MWAELRSFLEAFFNNSLPWLFQLLESTIPWFVAPFFIFKARNGRLSPSSVAVSQVLLSSHLSLTTGRKSSLLWRTHTVRLGPCLIQTSQVVPMVKILPANARDVRDANLIPRSGRTPGGGHGNPLQYSCLNPMDRRAWRATAHRVALSQTWLKATYHTCLIPFRLL